MNIMTDDEYRKIFHKKLNYYMHINNKSQSDLVNDLGISQSTVSNWCTGLKLPRMGKIQMLADYFGINKSDLIEEKPEPTETRSKDTKEHISNMIKNEYGITTHKAFGLLVRLDDLDKEKTIERMEVYLEDSKYAKQKGILEA